MTTTAGSQWTQTAGSVSGGVGRRAFGQGAHQRAGGVEVQGAAQVVAEARLDVLVYQSGQRPGQVAGLAAGFPGKSQIVVGGFNFPVHAHESDLPQPGSLGRRQPRYGL